MKDGLRDALSGSDPKAWACFGKSETQVLARAIP
jgi:hypothetical protein